MIVNMSRKGNCWDNAAMESFFGSLKEECVGSTIYQSHEEAKFALFTYLEIFSTRIRRHSTLGYVSPVIYEQRREQDVEATVGRHTSHCSTLRAQTLRNVQTFLLGLCSNGWTLYENGARLTQPMLHCASTRF